MQKWHWTVSCKCKNDWWQKCITIHATMSNYFDQFFIHRVPKKGDTKLVAVSNSINSHAIFKIFSLSVRFSSKFAAKYLLKIPSHLICITTLPCESLMSENGQQSQTNVVISAKLLGTLVTYLRCGGIFNNQSCKGLLLSLSVKQFLKSVNIWHSYGQKGGLRHALSSTISSVVVRCTTCNRQPRSCL